MTKILDFVEDKSNYFALFFCLIFLFTAFFSVQGKFWEGLKFSGLSLTSDEVSHIPSGFYYLKTKQYYINTEHPFLIKDIAAAPLLFLNLNLPKISEENKYDNIQWGFGRDFLFNAGNNPDIISFWSRTAVILFNTLLLFLSYYFLKRALGVLPALIAIFFLAFSPNVIAHSSLVVFDIPLAFLSLLSILSFSLFLEDLSKNKKAWKSLLIVTLFTALALLSKFQALLLLPTFFLAGFIYVLIIKKRGLLKKYILFFTVFLALVLLFIGVTFAFQTINMSTEGIRHHVESIYPMELQGLGKNFLIQFALSNPLSRGLTEYLLGVFLVIGRAVGAVQSTYFLGKIYGPEGAGPAYYPILFFTKETLGFLFLLFLTVILAARNFLRERKMKQNFLNFLKSPLNLTILSFLLIYGYLSFKLHLQIGIRYVFPIIFLIYVLVAKELNKWLLKDILINKKMVKLSLLVAPFFVMIIYSCVSVFPYYLSFFNLLAGGAPEGYKIATDSNYDWLGQDVKRLGKWVKDNKINKVYTHVFTNVSLKYYLGEAYQPYDIIVDPIPPSGSYIAVSAFALQHINYDQNLPESKKYFQFNDNLTERVGSSIFIYRVSEGSEGEDED